MGMWRNIGPNSQVLYTFGMKGVIGIDEVGRGPLAGPLTLCACYIEDEKKVLEDIFQNTIRDSKKLTKSLRNNIYQTIKENRYSNTRIEYAISSRSAQYIDKHGLAMAAKACVRSCLRSLRQKGIALEEVSIRLDAGLSVPIKSLAYTSHIKGDESYVEIALASIMAKVQRDAYMDRLSRSHREYAWSTNAGYGTREHRKAIETIGTTKYHRISFLKGFKLLDKAE
jgi:ribonuclease HII